MQLLKKQKNKEKADFSSLVTLVRYFQNAFFFFTSEAKYKYEQVDTIRASVATCFLHVEDPQQLDSHMQECTH